MSSKRFRRYARLLAATACAAAVTMSGAQAFSDVANTAHYKSAVDWAVSGGITFG